MYGKERLNVSTNFSQRAKKITETSKSEQTDPLKQARAAMREQLGTKGGRKLR